MTKIPNFIVLSIMAISFSLNSCINCIDGNGSFASDDRSGGLKEFKHIELDGSFNLIITQDTIQKLVIEGDENILRHVTSSVSGDRLIVSFESNRCFDTDLDINIRVSLATLESVHLDGSGDITCNSLNTNQLDVEIHGSGDVNLNNLITNSTDVEIDGSGYVYLSGQSTSTLFEIEGSGDIRAENLYQERCKVSIDGSGTIYTNFTESLTGIISGSGTIYYTGPKGNVNIDVNGSGKIINNN